MIETKKKKKIKVNPVSILSVRAASFFKKLTNLETITFEKLIFLKLVEYDNDNYYMGNYSTFIKLITSYVIYQ